MRTLTVKVSSLLEKHQMLADGGIDGGEASTLTRAVRFFHNYGDFIAYEDVRFLAAHAPLYGSAKDVFESFFGPGSTEGSRQGASVMLTPEPSTRRSWER